MGKVHDYLYQSQVTPLADFCTEYMRLSEIYWEMADQDKLERISLASEKVLIDKVMGVKDYDLVKLSDEQIIAHFHKEKIRIYEQIPEKMSSVITQKINDFVNRNTIYARKLRLIIPSENIMTVHQYYYNYELVKQLLPTFESMLWRCKK